MLGDDVIDARFEVIDAAYAEAEKEALEEFSKSETPEYVDEGKHT